MLKGLNPTPELIARFWSKIKIGDGCWLWTASVIKGYGQFVLPRQQGLQRHVYAHRVAWELTNGPIPDGLNVCHHCDTPLCCNPGHLFLGTQKDNLSDARRKGRLDESRPRRLSEDAYREILTTNVRGIDLARKYQTSEVTIARIRMGIQGTKLVQRILQDEVCQPEACPHLLDVVRELLEPVPFRQLPVSGEVR